MPERLLRHGRLRLQGTAAALALAAAGAAAIASAAPAEKPAVAPVFTAEQAAAGEAIYAQRCSACHGSSLDNGEAPPLMGRSFLSHWGGKRVSELFFRTRSTMPPGAPGSLSADQYADLMAFLLRKNNLLPGAERLRPDGDLQAMQIQAPSRSSGPLQPGIALPPPPQPSANPLERISEVTDQMIAAPAEGDWLTWRRDSTVSGFSPLKQVNAGNVRRLRAVWGWSLPSGPNQATPLVHDGVMYLYALGDIVQALDAATGDLLWEYYDRSIRGAGTVARPYKKGIAIYAGRIFLPTTDGHVVALDAKTGDVVWDKPLRPGEELLTTGGPLVAKGKVIIGTSTGGLSSTGQYKGGYIVALDAMTGEHAWTFRTIPAPGEPGGDSWNDLEMEQRSGAGVWTPGSYDPETNLVFFGAGNTYDTKPLRDLRSSTSSNDALYTSSTLAIDPDTGRLVWHYQHQQNDQWDMDWAFERQIMTLAVNGRSRRVVVTAGKSAIHDILDARTGAYIRSIDLRLQNFVTAIDPETGRKRYDPALIPGDGTTKFVCPHVDGAKSWAPSSYDAGTGTLYAPLNEACMYMRPVEGNEQGLLTTGVRMSLSPRPGSDGLYGRLQAIDLATGETKWVARGRAPLTSGALATAGGLVFVGAFDRTIAAYDAASGTKLWSTRLNDVLNSSPITYSVGGTQYVAVVLGPGGPHSTMYAPLVPEIRIPTMHTSSVWVFALPGED